MQHNPFNEYQELIFTVFNASPDEVARLVLERWRNNAADCENDDATRYHLRQVECDLSYAYLNKPSPPRRSGWAPSQLLFWEPTNRANHCVMMTNATCGNQHGVFRMSEDVVWECIYVAMRDQDEQHPSYMFDFYRDHRRVSRRFGVGQEENGRWLFCAEGPIQSFEEPSLYKKRRIVDRFNREVITTYLAQLGYDITQPEFWTSQNGAYLIWDDWKGVRSRPARDGVDEEGTS